MARPGTVIRVHHAVLDLAATGGPDSLTMEGIAARAGVGKQTLYRSWGSVSAILFDALLHRSEPEPVNPATDPGDLRTAMAEFLHAAIDEITTQPHETLLRSIAATIQTDEATAREFHERLLRPQLEVVHDRLRRGGVSDPEAAGELLLAPVFYRWFLRLPAMTDQELARHVDLVLRRPTG